MVRGPDSPRVYWSEDFKYISVPGHFVSGKIRSVVITVLAHFGPDRSVSFRYQVISSLGHIVLGSYIVPGAFPLLVIFVSGRFGPGSFRTRITSRFLVISARDISVHGHFDQRSFRSRVNLVPGHFVPGSF